MSPTSLAARLNALRELRARLLTNCAAPSVETSRGRRFRPELQYLEDRVVLDGTVRLNSGLLSITGSAGSEVVT
ncbi:MAG TPA: hypothetical protein VM529_18595, partial [Gemmata sp.]|nr:hypothetical protein [Gemmata sp.]